DNARVLAALDADTPTPLLPAAVKALREGRHPADVPDVVPLILRRQLAGSRFDDQIRDYLAEDLADAYAAAFPDFIETWRPHFTKHAKNLHAAADKLGPLL